MLTEEYPTKKGPNWKISCDTPMCQGKFYARSNTSTIAYTMASDKGWVHNPRDKWECAKDRCPECVTGMKNRRGQSEDINTSNLMDPDWLTKVFSMTKDWNIGTTLSMGCCHPGCEEGTAPQPSMHLAYTWALAAGWWKCPTTHNVYCPRHIKRKEQDE